MTWKRKQIERKKKDTCLTLHDAVTPLSRLSLVVNPLNNLMFGKMFNPLSPNSDQDQFSPNNIHTLSRDKLREIIHKMITQEKMP